jgi:hypothetical protein
MGTCDPFQRGGSIAKFTDHDLLLPEDLVLTIVVTGFMLLMNNAFASATAERRY